MSASVLSALMFTAGDDEKCCYHIKTKPFRFDFDAQTLTIQITFEGGYAMSDNLVLHQEQCSRNYRICETGGMQVRNPSAFWIPELTLHRKIGRTVYSVTGVYGGMETVDGKLERIMEQNLINMEENE